MSKAILIICMMCAVLVTAGCGREKAVEEPQAETKLVTQPVTLTAWEVVTMPNHPKLNDAVASVREFYKSAPAGTVAIVDRDAESSAVLVFQKQYADQKVGRYEEKDIGEVDKVICNVSATGVALTFEEVKSLILSYFPIELARENFVYDRATKFSKGNQIIYAWKYKSNGANWYRGKPPFEGNLTVMVLEVDGQIMSFGMFLGKDQRVQFLPANMSEWEVEPWEVEFGDKK